MLKDTHAGTVRAFSSGSSNETRKKASRKAKVKVVKKERLYTKGPVGEMRELAARAAFRLRKKLSKAKSYGFPADLGIVECLEKAAISLEDTVLRLDRVPASWAPAKGSIGGGIPIEEGTRVRLKEASRKSHIELADTDVELIITRVIGGKVVVRVEEGRDKGMVLAMARSHVERVQ